MRQSEADVRGWGLPLKRTEPELVGKEPDEVRPLRSPRPRPGLPHMAVGGSRLGVF